MLFDGAQRPPREFPAHFFRDPQRAPRRGGLVGVIMRVGRARSRSACPSEAEGICGSFFSLVRGHAFLSTCLLIATFTGDVIAGPEEVRIPQGRHPTSSLDSACAFRLPKIPSIL